MLSTCNICNKKFDSGSDHFKLEDERLYLFNAINNTRAITNTRGLNHAYAKDYKRFLKRLETRLKIIMERLNDGN